ncbi:MAG: hypothetical protein ACR2RA_06930 [Geminicoccaceae bacterium]
MPDSVLLLLPLSLALIIPILGMTGCAPGSQNDPGLATAIRAHYAAHATEEQGGCRSPQIDSIQDHRMMARSANGEEVMLVRYGYFDRHADMDAAYDKLVHLSQPCGGIAERRFTLARSDLGYRVIDMSGERKGEATAR